jgi:DNA replication protein DnaC
MKRYENVKYEDVPENIRKLFEEMPKTKKGLYIHGNVGVGKTHIIYSLKKHEKLGRYLSIFNMTNILRRMRDDFSREAYEREHIESRIIEQEGIVAIDDVGSEKISDWVRETFYYIVNERYNRMRPMIFTSNLSIDDLEERVGDRTASRIVEMCEIVELTGSDRRLNNISKIKIKT